MRTFLTSIYFLFSSISSAEYIKNLNKPSCKTCIHFKPSSSSKYESSISRCELFGIKDIITDEITYDYASSCRSDESKCGDNGLYHIKDNNFEIKKLKHNLFDDAPLIVVGLLCVMYIVLVVQLTGIV